MQCFDSKMAKTAKRRIFPDTTLPFSDPKQLSPDSDQVSDKSDVRFKKMSENLIFEQKMTEFWTKKGPKMARFFFQNKNFH